MDEKKPEWKQEMSLDGMKDLLAGMNTSVDLLRKYYSEKREELLRIKKILEQREKDKK